MVNVNGDEGRSLLPDEPMREAIPVSVVILTKDEEAGLGHTLSRLSAFDQVIVVDSNSTDRTVEIARAAGAEVVNFTWDGKHPKKKQWSLVNAGLKHNWVLLLDADEYPGEKLVDEIRSLVPQMLAESKAAYDVQLCYRFAGKFLNHGHVVTKRSLLDVRRSFMPEVDDLGAPGIREVEGHYQPEADGPVGRLSHRLFHDDQDPVSSWFSRHNRYSDWEAYLRIHVDTRREIASKRTAKGALFDRIPCKPVVFFCYSYLVRSGFLDGRAGLDYALALSMYYWQIELKHRELKRHSALP